MVKKAVKNKTLLMYLTSFFIPFFIIGVFFAFLGVYPFGNNLFLIHDLNGQYISFFSYLSNSAENSNSLFYSFSQVFGLDTVGLSCYYLASPFNILLFLIKNSELAITLIILLKISASGLTFFSFLSNKHGVSAINLIFSSMYALSAYNLVYSHNLMWLDGVIFLPLIFAGIDILFKKSRPWFYIASLGAGIFANYYIGYMLCIASLIYFAGKLIMRAEKLKEMKAVIYKYIAASLSSGLISAVIILPTAALLKDGKVGTNSFIGDTFGPDILISKLCVGSYDVWQQHNYANIYCTVVAVTLMLTYFFNKRIAVREKILSGTSLILLSVSLMIPQVRMIWHIFSNTDGFPNRQAFIFCFLTVYLAYRSFIDRDGITFYGYIGVSAIALAAGIFLLTKEYSHLPKSMVVCSMLIAVLTISVISFKRENLRKYVTVILAVITLSELSVNLHRTLSQFEFEDAEKYYEYTNSVSDAFELIDNGDSGFYRAEKTFQRTFVNRTWKEIAINDPMYFSYNGLSCFNSSQKQFVKDFCQNIGFTTFNQWSCYCKGNTHAVDTLFGVKYVLDKENRFEGIYQPLQKNGDITIYRNPAALSIAYAADEGIESCNISGNNPFEAQNTLFKTILGAGEDIFTKADFRLHEINMTLQSEEPAVWKKSADGESYLEFSIKAGNGPLYAYFPSESKQNVQLEVNGESHGKYFDYYRHDVVYLGTYPAGAEVTVCLRPKNDDITLNDAFFYTENLEYLAAFSSAIGSGNVELEKISSSHLKGTVNVPESMERIMLTIPYQNGWNIRIDGKKADYAKAFGTFICVPVTAGQHSIELKYTPPYFAIGLTISLLTVLGLIIAAFNKQIKEKIMSWR